jgi:hypothetical protein
MMMYCRSRRPQRTHIHRVKNCSNSLAPSVGTTSSFLIKKIHHGVIMHSDNNQQKRLTDLLCS